VKVSINKYGSLVLEAENSTEAFALAKWEEGAKIPMALQNANEHSMWKGSKIVVLHYVERSVESA
jgi:hypothetical protein